MQFKYTAERPSVKGAPPKRSPMSATRMPQIPLSPTTNVSPGSSRLLMQASMPAVGDNTQRIQCSAQQCICLLEICSS